MLVAEVSAGTVVAARSYNSSLIKDRTLVISTLSWSVSSRFAWFLQILVFGTVIARIAKMRLEITNTLLVACSSFGTLSTRLETRLLFPFIIGSLRALFRLEFAGRAVMTHRTIVQISGVHANDAVEACDALNTVVVRFGTCGGVFARLARSRQFGAFGAIIATWAKSQRIVRFGGPTQTIVTRFTNFGPIVLTIFTIETGWTIRALVFVFESVLVHLCVCARRTDDWLARASGTVMFGGTNDRVDGAIRVIASPSRRTCFTLGQSFYRRIRSISAFELSS